MDSEENPSSTRNLMDDQCPLCERRKEPGSEFCSVHRAASANIESAYSTWSEAYGGHLSKDEYYKKLVALGETGDAVKEVIQHLRNTGGST